MSPFKQGDKVSIIPHRGRNEDGTVKHTIGVVTDPCKLTDMTRLDGSKVGFYVMVSIKGQDLGYHAASLELVA
jgi:hypothetical protein